MARMAFHRKHRKSAKGKKLNPKQKKEVKKMIMGQVETKVAYAPINDATVTNASGSVYWLTDIQQGLTDTNRIADTINLQHLNMIVTVQNEGVDGNNTPTNLHRLIIVVDHFAEGTAPTVLDLLEGSNSPYTQYNSIYQFDRPKRFKILFDSAVVLAAPQLFAYTHAVSQSPSAKLWKLSIPLNDLPCKYRSNTGLAADIGANNIFAYYLNDCSTAVSKIFANVAISFKDA